MDAVGGALLLLQSGLFIVCYGLAALVGYPLLWLLFVLAQIPIKQVEEFVLTKLMRPFLTEHVGDFEVFINDEIQALNIRRAILDAIDWLARIERCSHIIVAGHSQGAAVAYDALLSGEARAIERVRLLVTFGAAINNVWDLAPRTFHRLDGDLPRHIPWCDFWATYDPVAHGRIDLRPSDPLAQPPQEFAVANSFSVVSDHGGYVDNPEEFIGRLAQLIERPADRTGSRFWKPLADETPWVQQRRDRLLTLVAWRLWTIAVFCFAIIARSDRLLADGAAVWSWIASLPGVAAIAGGVTVLTNDLRQVLLPPYGPATFFGASFLLATAALVAAAREQQRATAVLPTIAASVVLLTFVLFPILFSLVLGVLAWCLTGLAAYLFFARVAFDGWHRRSGNASARSGRPTTRQRGQIAWRSAMVGLLPLAIAIAVPIVGALPPAPR
ncbi:MAG TPA: hypothetical protein VGT60_04280 [Candidatus Limnocylindria bacterium]|nr:hypothetical protein [Candidatus Limnocylindria bacterium]